MKFINWKIAVIIVVVSMACFTSSGQETSPSALNGLESKLALLEKKASDLDVLKLKSATKNNALRAKQLKQLAQQLFRPRDPWRTIGGKVYNAKDSDWFQFTGKVLEVKPNGILIYGNFGLPLESGFGERKYFVENFPTDKYPLADNETIEELANFVAHMGGNATYQFTSSKISIGVETVRRLEYGKAVDSPSLDLVKKWENQILVSVIDGGPDVEILKEIEANQNELSATEQKISKLKNDLLNEAKENEIRQAAQIKEKEKRQAEEAKQQQLALDREQAAAGDHISLRRMGDRYRDGTGVKMDSVKAAEYYKKADEVIEAQVNKLAQEQKLKDLAEKQRKIEWYVDQSDKGNVIAMIGLGKCYRDGYGVEKDLKKAKELFQKASSTYMPGFEDARLQAAKLIPTCEE